LGNLFKSSSESVEINELVVLITPRIIDSLEPTPAALSEDGDNGIPQAFRGTKPLPGRRRQPIGKPKADKTKAGETKPQNGAVGNLLESPAKAAQTAKQTPRNPLQLAYGT